MSDLDPAESPQPDEPATAADSDPAPPTPRRPLRIRPVRLMLGLLGSLVLVVLLTLVWVASTQSGLRFAIALAEDLAPGLLSIERIEGRLASRLALDGLTVRVSDFEMRAGRIDLDWSPLSLTGGSLPIARLAIRDLDLVLPPSPEEPKPLVLPDIVLPLRISLQEAQVERLRLFNQGASQPFFVIDDIDLSASLQDGRLDLARLEVVLPTPRLAARAVGRAELRGDYPLDLDLDWEMTQAPAIALQGSAGITGNLKTLEVRHRLSGSARADLDIRLDDPLGTLAWDGDLEILGADLPDFGPDLPEATITGRLETRGDLARALVTGRLDALAPQLPDFGHPAAVLDLAWADRVLEINSLELTEQVSAALLKATGRLDLSADPGRFVLAGHWERLRWPLAGELLAESPRGKLDASGTFDAFTYRLSLDAGGPQIPSLTLDLDGTGSDTGTRLENLKLVALGGELIGQGEASWRPEPSWTFELNGRDLNPAGLAAGLEDRLALRLTSSGDLDAFDYAAEATSVGPGLPPSRLSLTGRGDRRETRIEMLNLDTLGGRIQGSARLGWDPGLAWEASLDASDLDPSAVAPQWPGNLGGRVSSQGTLGPAGPDLVARIERLEGLVRGFPVVASGTVTLVGELIRIEGLEAASGPSALKIQGQIDRTLDLTFSLASSDLASLLPEARGSLDIRGKASGPRTAPRVTLELSARDAEWNGQGIAGLSGTLDLGLAPEDPFEIRIDGERIVLGDSIWNSLSVRGSGRVPDHRVAIGLEGKPLSVAFEGGGGLDSAGRYNGRVTRLDIKTPTFGDWGLRQAAALSIAAPRIKAGPLCLKGPGGAGGCLDLDRSAADRAVAGLDLDLPDLALLAPLLPDNLALSGRGRVRGRFDLAGSVLSGSATAELPEGQLHVLAGAGRRQTIDFSGSRLALESGSRALSARLGIPLADLGRIDGRLDLPGWTLTDAARPTQPLSGSLRAEIGGLDRVSDLVPDVTGIQGGLDLDLAIGGTLGAPGIKGEAHLAEVAFNVPLIGLAVTGLDVRASAPAMDRVAIQGQADVGGGRLDLTGDARLGGDGLTAEGRLSGKALKVADTRELFVLVSPNLDLALDAAGARLSGEILVPEARIRPRSIPAGVQTPSSDVVLVDRSQAKPFPLTIDVRLKLGDAVTLDAFGVRGRLAGELAMMQTPGREMLGNGQLQIIDGQYRLTTGFGIATEIGAPLNIVQGRMIYASSPIDNPGLVLQAERDGGATVAGVRVLGTLRDPKLAFFSETDPGMTQSEVMKFLVTGVAPRAANDSVNPGLAVGTYIAPKLFVEYESGLGDQSNSVKLRYDLTNRIEIQTETGGNQGADIFFTFER